MQRLRHLSQQGLRYQLESVFTPSTDDEIFSGMATTRCLVVFDFSKSFPVRVLRFAKVDLPPLYLIAEEVDYMFNLFKSLSPYETPQIPPQSQKPENIPSL